jgi:AcrR family transcriptional regulator
MTSSTRLRDAAARQERADRILDSARELLLKWGYKRVTIDDVAAHAGIGKGTIYLHWKTREELYFTVILREYMGAIDDMIADVRRDPREALLHRMVRSKYLVAMRGPLLRALFAGDPEVIGKMAKGSSGKPGPRLDVISSDYLLVLVEQKTIRPEFTIDELFYGVGAITGGFYLVDAMLGDIVPHGSTIERKADLLESIVKRSFEVEPPPGALEVIAPGVNRILTDGMDICRAFLRTASEGRNHKEESQ